MDSKRKWIFLIFGILVLFFLLTYLSQHISLEFFEETIHSLGIYGVILYIIILFFSTIFFFSVSIMTILSGVLFGKVTGTIIAVMTITVASTTCFLLARYFGRAFTKKLVAKGRIKKGVVWIENHIEKRGFLSFLSMRLMLLPYAPFSYAAGLVKNASVWKFTLATFLVNVFLSTILVFIGSDILSGTFRIIVPLSILVLVLLLSYYLRKQDSSKNP